MSLKRELAEVRRELHERTSERDEGLAAEVLVCGSAQTFDRHLHISLVNHCPGHG
jgi:hypothetical protein